MATINELAQWLDGSANLRAFLRMLRYGEGTGADDGYRVMFGGERFDSFADHPRRKITKPLGGKPITSTAAGAYQFLASTWDGLVRQYGFADFSPRNQDLGAVALILGRGALQDVLAGRFDEAVRRCNREWASLPGSPYGQPVITWDKARALYQQHGGQLDQAAPSTATPAPSAPQSTTPASTPKGSFMAPFIAAVLPALLDLVPKLGTLFSSGSETSERNIKAAQIVVDTAKEAISAKNEQDLLEMIQSDPAAAAQVRQAIEAKWYEITEVGGGIAAARAANEKYMEPGAPGFWLNPAFWITSILLLMPFLLLVDVLFVHPDSYSGELRVQIVTAVLTVIGVVGAYWLGTSFSSQRKTELQAGAKLPGA